MRSRSAMELLLIVVGAVALVLVYPLIYFVLGAFTGWLFSNVFLFAGEWLVSGLRLLGITVGLSDLPLFTATIGFVGAFFKNQSSSSK